MLKLDGLILTNMRVFALPPILSCINKVSLLFLCHEEKQKSVLKVLSFLFFCHYIINRKIITQIFQCLVFGVIFYKPIWHKTLVCCQCIYNISKSRQGFVNGIGFSKGIRTRPWKTVAQYDYKKTNVEKNTLIQITCILLGAYKKITCLALPLTSSKIHQTYLIL